MPARAAAARGLPGRDQAPGRCWSCHHGTVIGRLHHVIVDCPDPAALAAFYSELLGLPVTWQEDDFAVVSASDTASGIAFQQVPDFQPPQWPDPTRPRRWR